MNFSSEDSKPKRKDSPRVNSF
ncbi:BnaC09g14960D [Brassica napus]|uniref:BnaC09g14960D protein n=1 Tax=Brassica napus TaxID=3708 RepID=A0A078GWP7_BRANA|nr:BnaC09g14960D [Brassica napus]